MHIRGNGTDQIKLQAKSGEQSIICYSDAAVELYYDNTKRFETTNTGVSITGNNVVSGNVSAVDGTFSGNVSIGGTLTYEDVTNIDSVGIVTARTGIKVLAGGINAVGVVTGTNGLSGTILTAAQTNITSVGTLGALTVSGNINANGNIVGDNSTNISGINSVTATSFFGDGSGLSNVGVDTGTVSANSIDTGTLNVTGISTLVGFSTFNSGVFVAGISTFSSNSNAINANSNTSNAAINIQLSGDTKGSLIPESDGLEIGVSAGDNIFMHLNQHGGNTSDFIVKSSGSELFKIDSGTIESTFTSTDTGSSAGPVVNLYRNSASPADADYLGQIKFQGESDTGVQRNYAKITGKILDASNGTEDGIIEFAHIKAGAQTITGRFRSDSLQLLNSTNLSVNGTTTFEDDVTFTGASNNIVFDASDNALEFADDAKAKFGTGGDLEIYHDGSNSYISDSGTGALTIEASTLLIENAAGNQNMIQAHQSGAVNLYYANSKKFETTNTGAVVTGILTATSFSGDGSNLSNVGFTTSVGTFNASSGVATIDSFAYATEDYKVAEYTLHFTNGSDIQAQKLLVMQDGLTAYSQEFAVMSSASQLVSLDAIISGSNVLVRATPESGISGTTTFRWRRIVQE